MKNIDLNGIIKNHQQQEKIALKIDLFPDELKLLKLLIFKGDTTASALIEKEIEKYVEKNKDLLTDEIKA